MGTCSMTAEMSQWDLTRIKSIKAIRPYKFDVTLSRHGGSPSTWVAGNSESLLGRLFLSPDQRPFFCVTRPTRFLVGLRPLGFESCRIHHLDNLFNRPDAVRPMPEHD